MGGINWAGDDAGHRALVQPVGAARQTRWTTVDHGQGEALVRVPWSEHSGEDIEHCVAMLLCRENPLAQQRQPSRGDQGIDVHTPTPTGLSVYQVKRFTTRLSASHKKQIKKSWDAFMVLVHDEGLQVAEWVCVRPRNASREDEAWLAELTEGADFPTRWMGLNQINTLGSKYPEVIDWNLNADRDRIHKSVTDALVAMQLLDGGSVPTALQPGPLLPRFQKMARAINATDPHYFYEVHLERPGPLPDPVARPGMVMETSVSSPNENIRISVFARCAASAQERPISFRLNFRVPRDSLQGAALQDFMDYGVTAAGIPATMVSDFVPGGLSWEGSEPGLVTLGPALVNDDPVTRDEIATITTPEGKVLAKLELTMREPSTGLLPSEKVAREGQARFGGLAVQMRLDPEGEVQWRMRLTDMTGMQLEDALEVLTFVSSMRAPNVLRSTPRLRPKLEFWMPAVAPSAVSEACARKRLAPIALMSIRDRLNLDLVMHDDGLITEAYLHDVQLVEEIVRIGEAVRPWRADDAMVVDSWDRPDESLIEAPGSSVHVLTYKAAVVASGTESVRLGTVSFEADAVVAEVVQTAPDGGWRTIFKPSGESTCVFRWLGSGHEALIGHLEVTERVAETDATLEDPDGAG